jgi:hypothetical protein
VARPCETIHAESVSATPVHGACCMKYDVGTGYDGDGITELKGRLESSERLGLVTQVVRVRVVAKIARCEVDECGVESLILPSDGNECIELKGSVHSGEFADGIRENSVIGGRIGWGKLHVFRKQEVFGRIIAHAGETH